MNANVATGDMAGGMPSIRRVVLKVFFAVGLVPVLLVALVIAFGILEPRFLSSLNIMNIARQSTYLVIATLGQMLYLLTRHYDLSNGACVALTSVITAKVMTMSSFAHDPTLAILVGCLAGIGVGVAVGLINGFFVARFQISSFMVTLGTSSALIGAALMITSGIPITGLPNGFVDTLGTQKWLGIPVPVYVTAVVVALFYVLLNWTRLGRHAYAIGGNEKAAHVSGVPVLRNTIILFTIGSAIAAIGGLLLTARLSSGDANVGSDLPLLSIAAAALGGVSLYGGEGRLSGAVIGAVFIIVLNNGMDLTRVQSYVQLIVLGALLILALIVDRARIRLQKSMG